MSKRVKNVTPGVTNPTVRPTKTTLKAPSGPSAPIATASSTATKSTAKIGKPLPKPPLKTTPTKPIIKLKSTAPVNGNPSRLKLTRSTALTLKTSTLPDSTKRQPVRAVYDPRGQQQPQPNSSTNDAMSHKNVMNTVHNVTVLLPPRTPLRSAEPPPRNITEALQMANVDQQQEEVVTATAVPRDRTRTHTLGADEVLVLKPQPPPQSVRQITAVVHKDAVAFDIDFGDGLVAQRSATSKQLSKEKPPSEDEDEYEDDFDSYESDFESCSTTSSASDIESSDRYDRSAASKSANNDAAEETAPQTIDSVEPDSGMYDWKIRSADLQEKTVANLVSNDGQMDSGFGLSASSPTPKPAAIVDKPSTSLRSRRAAELLNKITLDTMSYALFELKPIPYDRYMRMFGHRSATQTASQTLHRGSDQDVQTDGHTTATAWTQFPAEFVRHASDGAVVGWRAHEHRAGCGRIDEDAHAISAVEDEETAGDVDYGCAESLRGLARFADDMRQPRNDPNAQRPLDLDRLNVFLQQTAITVGALCNRGQQNDLTPSDPQTVVAGSLGYRSVAYPSVDELRHGHVRFVVGNAASAKNVLFSVHSMDVQRPDRCLVSAWNVHDNFDTPLYVLSSWSAVTCLEMNARRAGLVFGGLADGFVVVWNVTDSKAAAFGRGNLSPCQLIEPLLSGQSNTIPADFGAVVAIRCCPKHDDQLFALHEYGLLTAWTLLPAALNRWQPPNVAVVALEQLAPWARQRLAQTAVLDLRCVDEAHDPTTAQRRRPKSGFERTRSHFESNLFSDAALQELQQMHTAEPPPAARFRCTDLLVTEDGDLLVACNRTHLIRCTAALHRDGTSRIRIVDKDATAAGAHATRLTAVQDSGAAIAVGMSDGSVRALFVGRPSENYDSDGECSGILPDDRVLNEVNIAAKSCAIQNIIEDERPAARHDDRRASEELLLRAQRAQGSNYGAHPLRWRNQQRLMHGLALNAHPVQWLAHASSTNRLWVLQGGALRVFDCERMEEILVDTAERRPDEVKGPVVSCGLSAGDGADKLTLLTIGGDIQVHSLGRV